MNEFEQATAAKTKLVQQLHDRPGITGIGIGWAADGKRCLQVYVDAKLGAPVIPSEIDGFRVEVVRSESVRFQQPGKHSPPARGEAVGN
jgi:hypothetical protein